MATHMKPGFGFTQALQTESKALKWEMIKEDTALFMQPMARIRKKLNTNVGKF
jgi:hypothetical protein